MPGRTVRKSAQPDIEKPGLDFDAPARVAVLILATFERALRLQREASGHAFTANIESLGLLARGADAMLWQWTDLVHDNIRRMAEAIWIYRDIVVAAQIQGARLWGLGVSIDSQHLNPWTAGRPIVERRSMSKVIPFPDRRVGFSSRSR